MNTVLFIAKRIAFNKQKTFSRFIIQLSIAATAVSVAAMLITLAFVNGFQHTVSEKVFSFWGHLRVQHYELNKSLVAEENPITNNDTVVQLIKQNKAVKSVSSFATKSTILQHKKEIEGCLIKGISANYNKAQLLPFITKGSFIAFEKDSNYSKQIMVSQPLAEKLLINVNDTIKLNFIQQGSNATYRKLKVVGIYKTGIEEFDKLFVIADIRLVQKINNWDSLQIGGYEVFLHNYEKMDTVANQLQLPIVWQAKTIKQVHPNIFEWLMVMNVNRNVVFVIMGIVAVINLITCLLILVLERTKMVGLLKAFGMPNTSIQKIFLAYAAYIACAGVGIGLVVGLGICFLQAQFGFITMNEANYAVAVAPIYINFLQVLAVVVCTLVVCVACLVLPTFLIKKIKPIKAVQFR